MEEVEKIVDVETDDDDSDSCTVPKVEGVCVRVVACRIKTEEKDARVRAALYKTEAVGREPVPCHVPESLAGGS